VLLDIPICDDDRVHCVDILDALTKNFLGTGTDGGGDLGDLQKGPERKDYNPVSSTMKRQREYVVARLIQRTWRQHARAGRGGGASEVMTGGASAMVITVDDADADASTVLLPPTVPGPHPPPSPSAAIVTQPHSLSTIVDLPEHE